MHWQKDKKIIVRYAPNRGFGFIWKSGLLEKKEV